MNLPEVSLSLYGAISVYDTKTPSHTVWLVEFKDGPSRFIVFDEVLTAARYIDATYGVYSPLTDKPLRVLFEQQADGSDPIFRIMQRQPSGKSRLLAVISNVWHNPVPVKAREFIFRDLAETNQP
jgi:hypothetical protein